MGRKIGREGVASREKLEAYFARNVTLNLAGMGAAILGLQVGMKFGDGQIGYVAFVKMHASLGCFMYTGWNCGVRLVGNASLREPAGRGRVLLICRLYVKINH